MRYILFIFPGLLYFFLYQDNNAPLNCSLKIMQEQLGAGAYFNFCIEIACVKAGN